MDTLGNKLKQLRENSGMLQKEVAEQLKISQSTYAMYEKNKREPNLENLVKIAALFNISLDWLVGLDASKENTKELTVREFLRLFFKLTSSKGMYTHSFLHDGGHGERKIIHIFLNDVFNKTMDSYSNLLEMYNNGQIDYHLLSLWLEDEISKYPDILLSEYTEPDTAQEPLPF